METVRPISKFTLIIQGLDFKFSFYLSVLSFLPNVSGAIDTDRRQLQTALSSLLAWPGRACDLDTAGLPTPWPVPCQPRAPGGRADFSR